MVRNDHPQNGPGRFLLVVYEDKKSVIVIGPVHTGDDGRLRRWRGVSAGAHHVDNWRKSGARSRAEAGCARSSTAEDSLSTAGSTRGSTGRPLPRGECPQSCPHPVYVAGWVRQNRSDHGSVTLRATHQVTTSEPGI